MAGTYNQSRGDGANFLGLLASGDFADAEVVCGSKTWKIHQAIVCTRSVWFEKALNGQFMEANTKRVILDEDDPDMIEMALKFLYADGEIDLRAESTGKLEFTFLVDVAQISDFLMLDYLQREVQSAMKTHCAELNLLFALLDKVDQEELKEDLATDIQNAVSEAYRWNLETEKKILLEFVWAARERLLEGGEETLQLLFNDTPDFITDLLTTYAMSPWTENSVSAPVSTEAQELATKTGENRVKDMWAMYDWNCGT